jgi:hypothetical protein
MSLGPCPCVQVHLECLLQVRLSYVEGLLLLTIQVSASTKIRDELRSILRTSLDKDITLKELDYQPSD